MEIAVPDAVLDDLRERIARTRELAHGFFLALLLLRSLVHVAALPAAFHFSHDAGCRTVRATIATPPATIIARLMSW